MTLPSERTRAVLKARDFLRSLLDKSATPRVPAEIRKQAYWVLRHFPGFVDLAQSARKLPKVWGEPEDHDD